MDWLKLESTTTEAASEMIHSIKKHKKISSLVIKMC